MELFSEIYNCYYQVVARILEEAARTPLTQAKIAELSETYGYGESALSIVPRLIEGDWQLLTKDTPSGYRSRLCHPILFPLTALQKSWLKALLQDERLTLFLNDRQLAVMAEILKDTEPLYHCKDFVYFDRYQDKDHISPAFRKHFKLILTAIRRKQTLKISYYSVKGRLMENITYLPCRIEYSAKDGKFRLYALFRRRNGWRLDILHIARIIQIEKTGFTIKDPVSADHYIDGAVCRYPVVLEISNERNALERTMLHFSCYQKKVEKLSNTGKYRCSIYFDKTRETELLIQVLAFGPVVRVLEPESFLRQIRKRVLRQQELTQSHPDQSAGLPLRQNKSDK